MKRDVPSHPVGMCNFRDSTPDFSTSCLPQQRSSQREGTDELAFQKLACIPQMPCPTAISRKSHPLRKIHVAVEISAVRALAMPATASQCAPANARPQFQRESDLMGPLSGLDCQQKLQ